MSLFNPNIPQPGDFLSDSQQDLLNNNSQLDTTMGVNHYQFSDNTSDNGKHKFLQIPEEGSDPTTAADEAALYTKVGVNPSETNLFYRAENSGGGGGFVYQLTHVSNAASATFGKNNLNYNVMNPDNNGGWTFLPGVEASGGLILQFGRKTNAVISSGTVTFPFVFPSGNAPFCIQITWERGAGAPPSMRIDTSSSTGFTYVSDVTTLVGTVNWIAIGN